jgi:predicted RNA-binding protein with PIN domain
VPFGRASLRARPGRGTLAVPMIGEGGGNVTSPPRRSAVPAVPEHLLVPLLETAAEVLRALEADEQPAMLRRLAGFDQRGLKTDAARRQLWRALETDDTFHERVMERFGERSEVEAALAGWSADEAFRRVREAAERADLPLLASSLYAARPEGWAFGLGAAAALAERQRREQEEEAERSAQAVELASLAESRRRAEEARAAADAKVVALERELRDERQGRRGREAQAERELAGARRLVEEAEATQARARLEADTAETRAKREAERARDAESQLREARRELAASEEARLYLERKVDRAPAPGSGLRYSDLHALREAAELAQRLATGLGGVAERARGLARQEEPAAPSRAAEPAPPARRVQPPVPPGMVVDSTAALDAMLRAPDVVLVVDGYNVSMPGWGDAPIADQRERLGAALSRLHARTRCSVTLVFDGSDVEGVRPPRRPGVRVVFSAAGEEADPVVVREAARLPQHVPVVVASSDAQVRADAEAVGARVVSSTTLLDVLRA